MTDPTAEKQPKLHKNTMLALAMMGNGTDARTALQIVHNKEKVNKNTVTELKKKYRKYSLQAPGMIKSANSQIKRILSGEVREITQQKATKDGQVIEYTEQIAPSDTNILAAAAMVYDRFEPAVRQTLNVNVEVDVVDMSVYANSVAIPTTTQQSQVIDITDNNCVE